MVFLGIHRALYDYVPQSENEIALAEGDLLMVLEKSTEDDWWKAKKKGAEDDDEEPEGLIPNNYVEEAQPIARAKALYDYTRQTDEELSFKEDAVLDVYDASDPDWTLIGVDGDYGFAPANYIEIKEGSRVAPAPATVTSPTLPPRSAAASAGAAPDSDDEQQPPTPDSPAHQSPAAALAGIIQKKSEQTSAPRSVISPPPNVTAAPRRRVKFTEEESDEEQVPPPRLPQRPASQQFSPPPTQYATPRFPDSPPVASPPARSVTFDQYDPRDDRDQPNTPLSASGYHLYNIYEYITQPGKNKKMPITLGINIPKGVIMLAPEKSRDGHQQEWTADNLELYSQEGKHVFLELKRPSKSVDLHCGAKDTASEIISFLGELSGAAKASGLREVLAAGSGHSNVQKKGAMLFDFMAQGDDEVTVAQGDEVLIIDDSASADWWQVRRLKNGKEGVVPSKFVEITGSVPISAASSARSGVNAGRSTTDQNRLEEEELARQASKAKRRSEGDARADQRGKRDSTAKDPKSSKPNPAKLRVWTDRSKSFTVNAEFLTIKDGKIHLHKENGVRIAVPVPKMSADDLEYVERVTGISLEDDKPLSDIKRRSTQRANELKGSSSGLSVEKKPKNDFWFNFFLESGVNPQICERYAQAFDRDEMGEENLPDITDGLLRTLGLKEGDILRVMKHLDNKFGRDKRGDGDDGSKGPLFTGPGGSLKNNTRKGRPAPPVQTNDVVDAKALEQKTDDSPKRPAEASPTPLASVPTPASDKKVEGFDDNAWDVKPSRQPSASLPTTTNSNPQTSTQAPAPVPAPAPAPAPAPTPSVPALTGSLGELSLLMPAIKPEIQAQPVPAAQAPVTTQATQQAQLAGATPSLFDQVAAIKSVPPEQIAPPRVRPQAPQHQSQNGLIAPPPQRAASAPQNQQSAFAPPPPLQPQLTGYGGAPVMHAQLAPPGQSMQDLNNQRLQQQMTGFPQQLPGAYQFQSNGIAPQPTGFSNMPAQPMQSQVTAFTPYQQPAPTGYQQTLPQAFQPMQTGFQQNGSPFTDPSRPPFQPMQAQPTGFNSFSPAPVNGQTGINRFLPPAIQPTPTGFGQSQSPPPMPPMPPMPQAQPLVPQKTGPAPSIRFGVQPANKLVPQPTGRANLAKATPQNPFGF